MHLVLDVVSLMDLSKFDEEHRGGGVGQAPFAPSMLLSVLICAYSHGVKSSRAIEPLCRRDAGYQYIVGEHVPDQSVIARFRRRHIGSGPDPVRPGGAGRYQGEGQCLLRR